MSDAAMVRYDHRIPTAFEIAGTQYFGSFDIATRLQVIGEVIGNNQIVGTWVSRTGI
jgi:hypothetical protein